MTAIATLTAGYSEGLRPTERERAALIRAMERDKNFEKRKFPRMMLEGKFSVLLQIEYVGGSTGSFRVYPWDLSSSGLGFFHRAYVHPGTRCTINAMTTDQQPVTLKGEVARCEHVSGTVHTASIKFEMEVDPEIFLGEGAFGISAPQAQTAPATPDGSPPSLDPSPAVHTGDPWWDTLANLCVELNQAVNARTSREVVSEKLMEIMAAAAAPATPPPSPAATHAPAPPPHAH